MESVQRAVARRKPYLMRRRIAAQGARAVATSEHELKSVPSSSPRELNPPNQHSRQLNAAIGA
eukprot:2148175-Pyramimonas_sp.AAC.1